MLTPGLKFCNKVLPNLKSVENVTGTFSGGGSGTDTVINQASFNRGFHKGFKRPRDLRADLEGDVRGGVNFKTISFDKSLLCAVDNAVVLMEQTKHQNAQMSYCISQFDITRLNISHATNTEVDFDIHVKIFLTVEGAVQNPTFLVQELAGTAKTVTPFAWYYFLSEKRTDGIIRTAWGQLQGKFDQFFKTVPNEEADENRKKVHAEMNSFFHETQSTMYGSIISSIGAEGREIARLKTELLALSEIGLNMNHPAVQRWLVSATDPKLIPPVEDVVSAVILHGQPIDQARQAQADANKELKQGITTLGSYNDLAPSTDAISARLNDLRKIKTLRATLASR
jgi:hypothetical protein